jgi:hypothetical protein
MVDVSHDCEHVIIFPKSKLPDPDWLLAFHFMDVRLSLQMGLLHQPSISPSPLLVLPPPVLMSQK